MPHDPDIEMDEMMEEMAEDLGRNREQEINNYRSGGWANFSSGWPFILGGIGLVILSAVVISFLLRGGGVSEGELKSITDGLVRIEKRLGRIEEFEGKTVELEKQIKELQNSITELQQFKAASEKRLGSLSQKMEQNQVRTPAQQKIPVTASPESSAKGGQYHIVKKGETLYGISQKYGLKVDDLRRINKLKPGEGLHPGQRLLIVP